MKSNGFSLARFLILRFNFFNLFLSLIRSFASSLRDLICFNACILSLISVFKFVNSLTLKNVLDVLDLFVGFDALFSWFYLFLGISRLVFHHFCLYQLLTLDFFFITALTVFFLNCLLYGELCSIYKVLFY